MFSIAFFYIFVWWFCFYPNFASGCLLACRSTAETPAFYDRLALRKKMSCLFEFFKKICFFFAQVFALQISMIITCCCYCGGCCFCICSLLLLALGNRKTFSELTLMKWTSGQWSWLYFHYEFCCKRVHKPDRLPFFFFFVSSRLQLSLSLIRRMNFKLQSRCLTRWTCSVWSTSPLPPFLPASLHPSKTTFNPGNQLDRAATIASTGQQPQVVWLWPVCCHGFAITMFLEIDD